MESGLVISSISRDRYNELFRFLLSVRRVHTMLQEAWEVQMQHKERAAEMGLLWQLRSQMAFLVDNLQYYVQVGGGEAGRGRGGERGGGCELVRRKDCVTIM